VNIPHTLRRHWRTLAGVAIGAGLGGGYAYFVGCQTGTCPLTSNVWTAAAFFGFTGGVVGFPGPSSAPRAGDAEQRPPF
jgi:uncharacterized protein DUF6132